MILLLKNGEVYSPDYVGIADVLVLNGKIAAIERGIDAACTGVDVDVRDMRGMRLVPGFIDNKVHIAGGGGEAGFHSRTAEVQLSSIIECGVTTVAGVLGTGASRHIDALLAKAKGLAREGISAYIYTGSGELPPLSLTGSARRDVAFVDEVIGTGEIAIFDHYASSPTMEELIRAASDTRAGAMLSGKAGVLSLRVGSGKEGFGKIFKILKDTDIPIKHFLPTNVTCDREIFEQSKIFAALGGTVDVIVGGDTPPGVTAAEAVNLCLEAGVPIDNVTFSSDGNNCVPVFDKNGGVQCFSVTKQTGFIRELKNLIASGIDLSMALKPITTNPARVLGLPFKGRIEVGCDADITTFNDDMNIESVIARGRVLVESGKAVVKGTFEV